MPHQCTACGHTFADGSKGMLGGCPDCGGNKFQFYPEGTEIPDQPPADAEPPSPPEAEGSSVASTVGRATTKVRDFVSSNPSTDEPPERTGESVGRDSVDGSESSTPGASDDSENPTPNASDDSGAPNPNAPWPDSSDAADPIRKGGFDEESASDDPAEDGTSLDDADIIDADARAARDAVEQAEDTAQSDARGGIASEAEVAAAADDFGGDDSSAADSSGDDLPTDDFGGDDSPADGSTGDLEAAESTVDRDADTPDGRVVSEPTGEEPDLSELRQQLNDQFESIKILEPGQYELNLMELYDREEYIIALQENGRYVIQVPEQWMGDRDAE